jgi:hypothetical protein
MSDPKKAEPDEDLLEFLGGIDEVNDSQHEDFTDFLASEDAGRTVADGKQPKAPPPQETKHD